MRNRRRRSGVSTGTVATLVILVLVAAGSALLFPKLLGHVDQRVSPQQVGVAIENSFSAFSGSVLGQPTATPDKAVVTAPPTATLAPQQTATPVPARKLTFTAAGELSFDRKIQTACETGAGYDFDFYFEQIKPRLTSDINLAALYNVVLPGETLTDINMPAAAVSAVAKAGFNVLSTGFYGALDGGVEGLQATLSLIEQSGMLPYGTYLSPEQRSHVTAMEVNGVKVAFLSFQAELSAAGKKATTKEEQAYVFAQLTLPVITADIAAARGAGANVVVVSLCWGAEDATEPTKLQTEMAQGIADAGADIILGTNPGVLQKVSILTSARADGTQRQTLCAYSLGSIINSDRRNREVITSAMLHLSLRCNPETCALTFETITYTPVYIWRGSDDGKTTYQPVVANAAPPAGMNENQLDIMGRALADVRAIFANSLIEER
ncbi:MAG: CapA family protein [Clostridiales bacterium]|nr:CapA family protein [Clostridiales bacterium]